MHAKEMKRGDLIMACHDAKTGTAIPYIEEQTQKLMSIKVGHIPAFLGKPRRILWFSPLTGRPVVWAGGLWFAAVKSWVGVR